MTSSKSVKKDKPRVRFADTETGDLLQTDIDSMPRCLPPSQLALKHDITHTASVSTTLLQSPTARGRPMVTYQAPPGREYLTLLQQTKAVYDQLLGDKQVSEWNVESRLTSL